jgi:hypothetical protein
MPLNSPTAPPLLVSERQAAALLNLSVKGLYNLRRVGGIPFLKIGSRVLYSPVDLAGWIQCRKMPAVGAAGREGKIDNGPV